MQRQFTKKNKTVVRLKKKVADLTETINPQPNPLPVHVDMAVQATPMKSIGVSTKEDCQQ